MTREEFVKSDSELQLELLGEAAARDRALDLIETHRAPLVDAARAVAIEIAETHGRVTSPEVLRELVRRGYDTHTPDRRFMGVVFRRGAGWSRIGWEPTGSHCRPVAIWTRKESA